MTAEGLSEAAGILTGGPQPTEAETPEPEPAQPEPETPAAETLLSATDPGEPETSPEQPPEATEGPQTLTVKELAAKLETTPRALYEALQVDIGGEQMTLGAFKDRAKDLIAADTKLTDAQKHVDSSEMDILRKTRALNIAMQTLGRTPTEAEVQRAADIHNEYAREQAKLTIDVIPAWSDPAVMNADHAKMGALLSEYGFTPVESGAIHDYRHVKLLRDFSALRDRLKTAAKSEVTDNRNQSSGKRRRSAPTKKSAVERFHSGELSQNQAVLAAIAAGAKK